MKKKYLASFIIFSTITISLAYAYITGEKVVLRYRNSEIGFSHACSYYIIDNGKSTDLTEETLRSIENDRIENVIGYMDNGEWEYQYLEKYMVDVPTKVCYPYEKDIVNKTHQTKETIDNCTWGSQQKVRERIVWISKNDDISKVEIKAGKTGLVRFCADIHRERTSKGWEISVDHIPRFDGTIYDKFAWWNSNFEFRYEILSNATSLMPIAINNSYGFAQETIWTENASVGENIYVYTVTTESGNISIANETHEKNWEFENSTGNHQDIIWDGASVYEPYLVVLHMNNTLNQTDASGNCLGDKCPTSDYTLGTGASLSTTKGVFGQALNFSAQGGDIGNTANLGLATGSGAEAGILGDNVAWQHFTVSFWINLTKTDGASATYIWEDSSDDGRMFGFIDATGSPQKYGCRRYWSAGNEFVYATEGNFSLNRWIHFACRWNKTYLTLFINGSEIMTLPSNQPMKTDYNNGFRIGSSGAMGGGLWGELDEFRIYNGSLSDEQIYQEWENGYGFLTGLDQEEIPFKTPTGISLYLNGTEGNKDYDVGQYANFSAEINESGLIIDLDSDFHGWVTQSGTTKVENVSYMDYLGTNFYMNASYDGNDTFWGTSTTYYFNVSVPDVTEEIAKAEYGIDITFITDKFNIKVR